MIDCDFSLPFLPYSQIPKFHIAYSHGFALLKTLDYLNVCSCFSVVCFLNRQTDTTVAFLFDCKLIFLFSIV
uniref:Uncharacterized protein n=1 Tax=Arundo donax TaxID=35708 RepID=A0A0A9CSA7_ARUDO